MGYENMKRKAWAWFGIVASIIGFIAGIFSIVTQTYYFSIAIPIGIWGIFKYLPDVRGKVKHEGQTH